MQIPVDFAVETGCDLKPTIAINVYTTGTSKASSTVNKPIVRITRRLNVADGRVVGWGLSVLQKAVRNKPLVVQLCVSDPTGKVGTCYSRCLFCCVGASFSPSSQPLSGIPVSPPPCPRHLPDS